VVVDLGDDGGYLVAQVAVANAVVAARAVVVVPCYFL
jgi:hypothetical protein